MMEKIQRVGGDYSRQKESQHWTDLGWKRALCVHTPSAGKQGCGYCN